MEKLHLCVCFVKVIGLLVKESIAKVPESFRGQLGDGDASAVNDYAACLGAALAEVQGA